MKYLSGFGNQFETEAEKGALPNGQNSPQKPPRDLIPEQLSGSAFTAKRKENFRSWQYRIRPSVLHEPFQKLNGLEKIWSSPPFAGAPTPQQLRWSPLPPLPPLKEKKKFFENVMTFAGNGDPSARSGSSVLLYQCSEKMQNEFFYNSDAEMLFVPQSGKHIFKTEFGSIEADPCEIVVIPRGIKFQLSPEKDTAQGYICEIFGSRLELPNLGPIGSNGLANPRDFLAPEAQYEDKAGSFKLITKFAGHFWEAKITHSPFDVVAWHGNYYPYKYDLRKFNTIGSVSFDHPDPSIFTVLTSPSYAEGTANVDFVIFPPRWMVAEHTFRPPYFHRNIMSEYMGLIHGVYDAKPAGGFDPFGGSLHNCMSAHGPEADAFIKASEVALKPEKIDSTLAFMFESSNIYHPTEFAMQHPSLQKDYWKCWQGIGK